MSTQIDISSLDIATLTTVPLLPNSGYVTLIKSLLEVTPPDPPPMVETAAKQLAAELEAAEVDIVATTDAFMEKLRSHSWRS